MLNLSTWLFPRCHRRCLMTSNTATNKGVPHPTHTIKMIWNLLCGQANFGGSFSSCFICVLALIMLETGALSLGCWLLISRTSFQIICKFHHPLVICRLFTRYVMLFHPDISDFFLEHANQDCTAYLSLADTYCKICGRQINNSSLNSLVDFCSGMLKHQTLVLVTFLSRNTLTQTVMIFLQFFLLSFHFCPMWLQHHLP